MVHVKGKNLVGKQRLGFSGNTDKISCGLAEYNVLKGIFTMAVLIVRASVVEIWSVIRYLVFQQPSWSPSNICQEVYKVYGQQIPSIQAVWNYTHLEQR